MGFSWASILLAGIAGGPRQRLAPAAYGHLGPLKCFSWVWVFDSHHPLMSAALFYPFHRYVDWDVWQLNYCP